MLSWQINPYKCSQYVNNLIINKLSNIVNKLDKLCFYKKLKSKNSGVIFFFFFFLGFICVVCITISQPSGQTTTLFVGLFSQCLCFCSTLEAFLAWSRPHNIVERWAAAEKGQTTLFTLGVKCYGYAV